MAYQSNIFCPKCGENKAVIVSAGRPSPLICHGCQQAMDDAERAEHFTRLDALTIEERLHLIEEWIYDYKPQYVPEPRF